MKDINEKYRIDVRELLTSSLPFSSANIEEIEQLDSLLQELQKSL